MESSDIKVVYNDQCVDLRTNFSMNNNNSTKTRTVATSLKRLIKNYNSNPTRDLISKSKKGESYFNSYSASRQKFSDVREGKSFKSRSELSTRSKITNITGASQSNPLIENSLDNRDDNASKPFKNTFTMTSSEISESMSKPKKFIEDKSLEDMLDNFERKTSSKKKKESKNSSSKASTIQKYSLVKEPQWKRSNTHPELQAKPSKIYKEQYLNTKRAYLEDKTYSYDDRTDNDSLENITPKKKMKYYLKYKPHELSVYNASAYVCGILLVSTIIWLFFDNKLLKSLFPKPQEPIIKRYFTYVAGSIASTLSDILKIIGRVFSIPTQQVYHTPTDFGWRPLGY